MALNNFRSTITALENFDFDAEQTRIIEDNTEKIADLQAEQWAKGLTALGTFINPPYSPYTIEQKRGKPGLSGVTDRVTFFNTGELYRSLQASVSAGNYTISSPSFKFQKAVNRSGKRIVGLTKDSSGEFVQNVTLPGLKAVLKQKVGLDIEVK